MPQNTTLLLLKLQSISVDLQSLTFPLKKVHRLEESLRQETRSYIECLEEVRSGIECLEEVRSVVNKLVAQDNVIKVEDLTLLEGK